MAKGEAMLPIIDQNAPSLNGSLRKPEDLPHALVCPPQRVLEILMKEEERLRQDHNVAINSEAKERLLADFTIQYHFEEVGMEVAYRPTPRGPEVLAVGQDEIAVLTKGMSLEERQKIKIRQP
jgi:hypothetical protein